MSSAEYIYVYMPIWIINFLTCYSQVSDCGYGDEALFDICAIARYNSRIYALYIVLVVAVEVKLR